MSDTKLDTKEEAATEFDEAFRHCRNVSHKGVITHQWEPSLCGALSTKPHMVSAALPDDICPICHALLRDMGLA